MIAAPSAALKKPNLDLLSSGLNGRSTVIFKVSLSVAILVY